MKTMKVYMISENPLSETNNVILYPRNPESSAFSEPDTDRICCCPTVIGCLYAIEASTRYALCSEYDVGVQLWLYSADVDVEKLYQPLEEVSDAWNTGELWIMESQEFTLVSECVLRRHMMIDNIYSRYAFHYVTEDEVVNRIKGTNIYGDQNSFSFIEYAHDAAFPELLNPKI